MTTVANTIYQQLGANKFVAMTGAKQFLDLGNGISFKIGRNGKGVNYVKITLNGSDLYDVKYQRVSQCKKTCEIKIKTIAESNGLYADMLQTDFTANTELYTRL